MNIFYSLFFLFGVIVSFFILLGIYLFRRGKIVVLSYSVAGGIVGLLISSLFPFFLAVPNDFGSDIFGFLTILSLSGIGFILGFLYGLRVLAKRTEATVVASSPSILQKTSRVIVGILVIIILAIALIPVSIQIGGKIQRSREDAKTIQSVKAASEKLDASCNDVGYYRNISATESAFGYGSGCGDPPSTFYPYPEEFLKCREFVISYELKSINSHAVGKFIKIIAHGGWFPEPDTYRYAETKTCTKSPIISDEEKNPKIDIVYPKPGGIISQKGNGFITWMYRNIGDSFRLKLCLVDRPTVCDLYPDEFPKSNKNFMGEPTVSAPEIGAGSYLVPVPNPDYKRQNGFSTTIPGPLLLRLESVQNPEIFDTVEVQVTE